MRLQQSVFVGPLLKAQFAATREKHLSVSWPHILFYFIVGDIMQLQFVKSALAVNPCMVSDHLSRPYVPCTPYVITD